MRLYYIISFYYFLLLKYWELFVDFEFIFCVHIFTVFYGIFHLFFPHSLEFYGLLGMELNFKLANEIDWKLVNYLNLGELFIRFKCGTNTVLVSPTYKSISLGSQLERYWANLPVIWKSSIKLVNIRTISYFRTIRHNI